MANVQYTENMTEEQLDAMAGSETLRYQATSFGATRNNKVHLDHRVVVNIICGVKDDSKYYSALGPLCIVFDV